MIRKHKLFLFHFLLLFIIIAGSGSAQDLPERPVPQRLVNDFAGILSESETGSLERKLVAFNDSTRTQIAIVTVDDLKVYDVADYAHRLAEKWGVGQKGLNNGVLILVKEKTNTSGGKVFIATGYGLEGVIPDITCGEIVDYEMLPAFRRGDYYEGLDKATDVLMSLARGEFPADQYKRPGTGGIGNIAPLIFIILFIIMILFIRSNGGRNQRHISRNGLPLWLLLSMMNSGRSSHSGSWGGFSGGGFGGRGGGFGGFGGGSFGGGGAGGSW